MSEKPAGYTNSMERLTLWLLHPGHICEDDLEGPSEESIWSAMRILAGFCRREIQLPRIVETGEGGIVVDIFHSRADITSYEIEKDGRIEKICFKDSRLVSREDVALGSEVAA